MLKLLKWDSLNFINKYYWVLLGFPVAIVAAAIPAEAKGTTESILIASSGLLGACLFVGCLFLAVFQLVNWLRNDSVLLELSLPAAPWKLLLSKLLLAVVINLLACILTLQLSLVFGKYTTGSITPISASHLTGLPELVLFLTLCDVTLLFAYLVSKSFTVSRGVAAVATGMISAFVMTVVVLISLLVMSLTESLVLPTISTDQILTLNGNFSISSSVGAVIVFTAALVLEFLLSSALLKNRFQRD